ncbi:hypothetical protein L0128_09310 [candidate division KSB1 bacterium]|nr:hypothetical protein [candidate division KSB1 bacterium]
MNILVTGISGLGRDKIFAQLDPQIKLYDLGQRIVELAKSRGLFYSEGNILRANQPTLAALRAAAVGQIVNECCAQRVTKNINLISAHGLFMLLDGFRGGLDLIDVEALTPQMVITLIDGPQYIHDRLREHPGDYFHLSVESIIRWQEFEVFFSEHLAKQLKVKHYVVPVNQPETLHGVIFQPERKVVYASYPMTHLEPRYLPLIRDFVNLLKKYFIVFDPAAIESSHGLKDYYTAADHRAIANHTIVRDLDWFIRINAEMVIAYWPTIVFSSGMNDELRFAYDLGKETILVTERPSDGKLPILSPFTTYKSRMFWSKKDLEEYLTLPEPLQQAYSIIQDEILDLLRLQTMLSQQLTKDEFIQRCVYLCRYQMPDSEMQSIESEIANLADKIFELWYPLFLKPENVPGRTAGAESAPK